MSSSSDSVERQLVNVRRKADQQATMHAILRDRLSRRGTALQLTILAGSVTSTAFAFAGPDSDFELLGQAARRTTWLGLLAVMTLVLVVAELVLNLRGRAAAHKVAVDQLSAWRSLAAADGTDDSRVMERYREMMESVPPIPEAQFNRLKSRHLRKVEVSKQLSANPGQLHAIAWMSVARRRSE